MNGDLDKIDLRVVIGLLVGVIGWAFIWAEPYPHPDLWPFLAAFGWKFPLSALSVAGKVLLGVFAALVYLVMRCAWLRHRDIYDELPDNFFFTRFCPLCGTVLFICSSYAWRSAQYLTPDFLMVVAATFALFIWQRGCGFVNLLFCIVAYLVFGFIFGLSPLAVIPLAYIIFCDTVRRWQVEQMHGQREDDAKVARRRYLEGGLTVAGGILGFGLSIYYGAAYFSGWTMPEGGIIAIVLGWWHGWLAAWFALFQSKMALVMLGGVMLAVVGLALGRRLREDGQRFFAVSVAMAVALGIAAVITFVRAIDSDERMRLGFIREYVLSVMNDSRGARWLFTDGRFDDALRFELKRRKLPVCVLNALTPPKRSEIAALQECAPEHGDRELFAAGGAEVFKAWARERPDRLSQSAWQLGTPIVRRFGKVAVRSCGAVMRTDEETTRKASVEADRRFSQLTQQILEAQKDQSFADSLLDNADAITVFAVDAIAWRAARMAGERSETSAKTGNMNAAQTDRVAMQALDASNGTLKKQCATVERLLPTMNLVLTPREALEVSLKRADFILAERYAREVLVSSPDDVQAHFALGMASLQGEEYFSATRHFEKVLAGKPDEPATLNNLSLAYLKLGKLELAKETAEKALKVNPKSKAIKDNLAEICRQLKATASPR